MTNQELLQQVSDRPIRSMTATYTLDTSPAAIHRTVREWEGYRDNGGAVAWADLVDAMNTQSNFEDYLQAREGGYLLVDPAGYAFDLLTYVLV